MYRGFAHADVAIPWYIKKHYPDIEAACRTSSQKRIKLSDDQNKYTIVNRFSAVSLLSTHCKHLAQIWELPHL